MIPPTDEELDRRTVDLVTSSLPVPERSEEYGRDVWARLAPALAASRTRRRSFSLAAWSPWAAAAAIVLLVAGAFLLGRATSRPPEAPLSAEAKRRILLVALGDHLERSRIVLLELVNAGPHDAVNPRERALAEELVAGNRLYRQTALRSGEAGMADVLDELERVLLEIANSPANTTPEARAALARRIESEGVLFKIEILGERAGQRAERPPARAAALRS